MNDSRGPQAEGCGARRLLACVCIAAALPLLTACALHEPAAAPAATVKPGYPRFQLIVKFKPTLVPKVDAAFIQRLSREVGVSLVFVRTMSGGASVLAVNAPLSAAGHEGLLRRLRARGDIEYVSVDRVMRPLAR